VFGFGVQKLVGAKRKSRFAGLLRFITSHQQAGALRFKAFDLKLKLEKKS